MNHSFIKYLLAVMLILSVVAFCGMPATAFAEDSCSYNFSWLPYTEFSTVKYEIHYGQNANGPYPNVSNVGNPSPVNGRIYGSVPGLSCNQTYYFVVVAVDGGGSASDDSQQVRVVGSPTNLHIVSN